MTPTPQTPPTDRPLTAGDGPLLLKLMDTLKPFAEVAEKLKHCHVVEICEPTPDNPSRNIIPMPREWFERAGDDLEAIVIQLHSGGVLSEGQASKMTGLDRIEVRKLSDAYRPATPAASEGEPMRLVPDRVLADALYWMARGYERVHSMPRVSDTELANKIEAAKAALGRARDASAALASPPSERESFDVWMERLRTDVIQDEYGYEEGEFDAAPADWRPMYDQGLSPSDAFRRALTAHREPVSERERELEGVIGRITKVARGDVATDTLTTATNRLNAVIDIALTAQPAGEGK